MTDAEELQDLTSLMNIMIYDLAILGVKVESTNVENDNIQYNLLIPSKSESYTIDELKNKIESIIYTFIDKCEIDKDKISIVYNTKDEEWTNEKSKQMKNLIQTGNIYI